MKKLLSICIATLNRADFIKETLDSILDSDVNSLSRVEIVIIDGASTDNTAEIIKPYTEKYSFINYIKESLNSGVDCDYDKAVKNATGIYCWLLPDDDILCENSLKYILEKINENYELFVINSECYSADLTVCLNTKMLNINEDIYYTKDTWDLFFKNICTCLSYIGSVVIKREVWMVRNRTKYYGSLFVHIGVIFQAHAFSKVMVVAKPLIKIRYGNSLWSPKSFEVWYFKWPALVWSFENISTSAKNFVVPMRPWKSLRRLLVSRAMGDYSFNDYYNNIQKAYGLNLIQLIISILPAHILNTSFIIYYLFKSPKDLYALYDLLRSKYSTNISKKIARYKGVNFS